MPYRDRPSHRYRRSTPVEPPGLRPLNDGCTSWRDQGPAAEVLAMPVRERKPRPLLEINERPARDLRALIDSIGQVRVERELNVHRTTVKRWLNGQVHIPGHQHQVIKMLLGDLPGTCGQWSGWRFHEGLLLSPDGDTYRPGDVLSLIILRQQLTAQRRELEAMKVKLAIAENAVERLAPAANDARARA